jgi:5-formyltetrahydrofolate cyclo-ligase
MVMVAREVLVGVQQGMTKPQYEQFTTKAAARAFARRVRRAWSPALLDELMAGMMAHLAGWPPWQDAGSVLTYVGALPGELPTMALVTAALDGGKAVWVPLTRPNGRLEWARITTPDALIRSSGGLLEPAKGTHDPEVDRQGLCVVPGMLFSRGGHRIGFGGGYYDRFLPHHPGPSVGLCPRACYGHQFPIDAHDQPVAWVVTEGGIHEGSGSALE